MCEGSGSSGFHAWTRSMAIVGDLMAVVACHETSLTFVEV